MPYTNEPNGLTSFGVPVLPGVPMPFTGNYFFCDPVDGNDGYEGTNPQRAVQTLYRALELCRDGNNDVVFLIGNGQASGSARLSLALAQTRNAAATSGVLTWNKNACHLIGLSPAANNSRSRIAPPTGTYTQATFGSGNFVVVSATGCLFMNLAVYHGFSTGGTNQIAWTDSGGRNTYVNCQFQGMNDAASAADTGSRSLKISGTTGENLFVSCVIGNDTTARSVANASLELAGGTPRNIFRNCLFPFMTSNAGVLGVLGTGAACMDRYALFDNCAFMNAIKSTSTQMTVLASFTDAAPGGFLNFKDSPMIGITKYGDTNGLANSFINMPAVSAAAGGLELAPA